MLDAINGGAPRTDPELAAAVARLAATLNIGDRNTSLTLTREARVDSGDEPRRAVLDAGARSMQVTLDAEAFWRSESFATLQAAQGTTGHVDPAALAINDLTDRERADLLRASARSRYVLVRRG